MKIFYDVYDFNTGKWALWKLHHGYLTEWMTKEAYLRYWKIMLGVTCRQLPNKDTIYPGDIPRIEKRG